MNTEQLAELVAGPLLDAGLGVTDEPTQDMRSGGHFIDVTDPATNAEFVVLVTARS